MSVKQLLTNVAIQKIAEDCEPCPFCGCQPNIFQVRDDRYITGEMNWVIECRDMGCIFKRSVPNRSLDNLLADWNKREGNQFWISA